MKEYNCLSGELSTHIKGIKDIEKIFGKDFDFHDAEVDEIRLDNYYRTALVKLWIYCRNNDKRYRITWYIKGFSSFEALNYDAAVNFIGCAYFEKGEDFLKISLDQICVTIYCKSMEIKVSEISLLQHAVDIAQQAHSGQVDKAGRPYIIHSEEVMNMCENETEKIVGVLHDVVEDTSWTFDMLEAEGFSSEVIEALRAITKLSEDENYDDFITRVMTNPLAVQVKKNDLIHNIDVHRLKFITDKDIARTRKYIRAYERLIAGERPDVRVQISACVIELQYIVNFCNNKKRTSVSECKALLVKEYLPCLKSIIPRLDLVIDTTYNDSPWEESRRKNAKDVKDITIEMLDYVDKIINTSEEEFNFDDLSSLGSILEYAVSELIFYTQKYFEVYP